jgi:hypothetical protein
VAHPRCRPLSAAVRPLDILISVSQASLLVTSTSVTISSVMSHLIWRRTKDYLGQWVPTVEAQSPNGMRLYVCGSPSRRRWGWRIYTPGGLNRIAGNTTGYRPDDRWARSLREAVRMAEADAAPYLGMSRRKLEEQFSYRCGCCIQD